jgi:DMSO/TMAO reductase YedYZ molybdopterin-dependent catalytic subunit
MVAAHPIDPDAAGGAPPAEGAPVGRRIVLGMVGLGMLGVAFGKPIGDGIASLAKDDPTGLSALIPAAGGFRYYSVVSEDPVIPRTEFRLPVGGLVTTQRVFSYADLAALPQTSITRDFQCVTGWRVPDVPWSGVLLRDVLALVGPTAEATAVAFDSYDGEYTESLTLEQAMRDDMLVATSMLGAPVTDEHGGPVRLFVGPMYGYKSLKWLSGIRLTSKVEPGYWEVRGYDIDAWVGGSNGRAGDEPV